MEAILLKHAESQLDPLSGQRRALGSHCSVFAEEPDRQLDVAPAGAASPKLEGPGLVTKHRMTRDDLRSGVNICNEMDGSKMGV